MAQGSILFGEELRRRRLSAGLTIVKLAQRVHYSKGQLSKVERGIKRPTSDLAILCDAALRADGELAVLASEKPKSSINRRQLMTARALTLPGFYLGDTSAQINRDDAEITAILRALFEQHRKLGQLMDPRLILPTLVAKTHDIKHCQRQQRTDAERTPRPELAVRRIYRVAHPGGGEQSPRGVVDAQSHRTRGPDGGDVEFTTYGFCQAGARHDVLA